MGIRNLSKIVLTAGSLLVFPSSFFPGLSFPFRKKSPLLYYPGKEGAVCGKVSTYYLFEG